MKYKAKRSNQQCIKLPGRDIAILRNSRVLRQGFRASKTEPSITYPLKTRKVITSKVALPRLMAKKSPIPPPSRDAGKRAVATTIAIG